MRYPIKNKTFIDDEFTAAVNMCKEENNHNILVHLYKAVKVIDRSKAKIIKEELL